MTFDLEKRTTEFAKGVIRLCKTLPRNPINDRLIGQVVGAAGSIGANYREANDALSKKDFMMRIKICRKESKETRYWLKLLDAPQDLIQEAQELMNIFGSIIRKSE